jgi:hypothetical protein
MKFRKHLVIIAPHGPDHPPVSAVIIKIAGYQYGMNDAGHPKKKCEEAI